MTNELISFQFSILNYHPMLLLFYVLTIEIPDVVKPSRFSSKYLLWSLSCASDLQTFSLANQHKRKTKLSIYFLLHIFCRVAIIFLFMLIREKWKSKLLMWFSLYSYEIEITSEVTGRAPTPELTIGVKQSGKWYNFLFILTFYNR